MLPLISVCLRQPATNENRPPRWHSVSVHLSAPVTLNWRRWKRRWQKNNSRVTERKHKTQSGSRFHAALFAYTSRLLRSVMVMFIEAGVFVFVYNLTSRKRERERVTFWQRRRACMRVVVWLTVFPAGGFHDSLHWLLRTFYVLMENIPFEIPALHILISFVGESDGEAGLGRARTFLFL